MKPLSKDAIARPSFFSRVLPAAVLMLGVYIVLRYGGAWVEAVSRFILALN